MIIIYDHKIFIVQVTVSGQDREDLKLVLESSHCPELYYSRV
jgi:hypothetical protein